MNGELIAGGFALFGAFIGFAGNVLINRLDYRKQKNESVFHERTELFKSIAHIVSEVPTANSSYDEYVDYFNKLDAYFKANLGKLVLYGDPKKIADKFSEFYILFKKHIESEDCPAYHVAFVDKGQEIIDAIKRYFNMGVARSKNP